MPRSSPKRGNWAKNSPRVGRQRELLKARCGNKCFLRPKDNGFPVCSAYSRNCDYNCKGLFSAKARANQYGYLGIARQAEKLLRDKCNWSVRPRKSRSQRRKSQRRSRKSRSRKSKRRPRKSRSRRRRSQSQKRRSQRRSRYQRRKSQRRPRDQRSRRKSKRMPRRSRR